MRNTLLVICLLLQFLTLESSKNPKTQKKCRLRETGLNGEKVCVCNSEYCDTVLKPDKVEPPFYTLYTSNKEGLRLEKTEGRFKNLQEHIEMKKTKKKFERRIYVKKTEKFQTVLGWGGAFTDSTGINIKSLDHEAQEFLMRSYFSDEGLEYNLCRVPIGGTDFSTRHYTYDDTDAPDPDLKHFNLTEEDYEYKVPYMKKALKLRKNKLKFFGSVWGAPKWMKTNNDYKGYGFLKKEYYRTWAQYFVKFFEEYKKLGLDFWGVTTQNEPSLAFMNGMKGIPTVGWNSVELGKWVRDDLGPLLNAFFPEIAIMVLDDQKYQLPWEVNSILYDPKTLARVDGIAVHWYYGVMTPCGAMNKTHWNYPDLFLLSTEACSGFQDSTGVLLGSWERGESYAIDIIENMNCWLVGWVDWNMVLDLKGGPTFINNTVDAPIVVNATANEFYKQPMYYTMGHFSKYVPEGSVRIGLEKTRLGSNMMAVAFYRSDGSTVIVILNKNDEDRAVEIIDDSIGVANLIVSKRSINTLLYW